nr:purple acid phosphatase 10 [Tanacetum cinerariifolium]
FNILLPPFGTPSRELPRTSLFCLHIRLMYKVDVVFAGHVHAYERSERVSNIAYNIVNGLSTPVKDQSAPVYITIGDGGNLEGLATK